MFMAAKNRVMFLALLLVLMLGVAVFSTADAYSEAEAGMTASDGVTWINFEDETPSRLVLSSVPSNDDQEKDVAVADLNRDGWLDVVVARKAPFSNPGARADLLLMNVNGVLEDQTAIYAPEFMTNTTDARDLFIMDFDGDGWEDVVIASTFEDQPTFYYNLGNGPLRSEG